jgi:hypothetical protein
MDHGPSQVNNWIGDRVPVCAVEFLFVNSIISFTCTHNMLVLDNNVTAQMLMNIQYKTYQATRSQNIYKLEQTTKYDHKQFHMSFVKCYPDLHKTLKLITIGHLIGTSECI